MVGSSCPFAFGSCGVPEPLDERVAEVDGGNTARGALRGISDDVFVHGNGAGAAVEEVLEHVEAMIEQVEVLVHVAVEQVNRDTVDTEKQHSQLYVSLLIGDLDGLHVHEIVGGVVLGRDVAGVEASTAIGFSEVLLALEDGAGAVEKGTDVLEEGRADLGDEALLADRESRAGEG
jgi:hypothetical protein